LQKGNPLSLINRITDKHSINPWGKTLREKGTFEALMDCGKCCKSRCMQNQIISIHLVMLLLKTKAPLLQADIY